MSIMSSVKTKPLDIWDLRKPYDRSKEKELRENSLPSTDPFEFFDIWFKEIGNVPEASFPEKNSCIITTATKDGIPSSRVVILEGHSRDGFKFFTIYDSRKSIELEENPNASIMLYWARFNRSIRIEGTVEKLSDDVIKDRWNQVPIEHFVSLSVPEPNKPIPSLEYLAECYEKMTTTSLPKNWGGYILKPDAFEFWQGQTNRLHDRIRFRKRNSDEILKPETKEGKNGWVFERLAP